MVAQLVQMAFYATAATLAILTYRSAKRGLLNTVRTEYQKRVMDRLADVATELWSEFDRQSDNWWVKSSYGSALIEEDRQVYLEHPDIYRDAKDLRFGGFKPLPPYERVNELRTRLDTDPFLPRAIREAIVGYLDQRLAALREVAEAVTIEYREYLRERQPSAEKVADDDGWVHNRANAELYKRGFGISQVQTSLASLRLQIQQYFESFNPDR